MSINDTDDSDFDAVNGVTIEPADNTTREANAIHLDFNRAQKQVNVSLNSATDNEHIKQLNYKLQFIETCKIYNTTDTTEKCRRDITELLTINIVKRQRISIQAASDEEVQNELRKPEKEKRIPICIVTVTVIDELAIKNVQYNFSIANSSGIECSHFKKVDFQIDVTHENSISSENSTAAVFVTGRFDETTEKKEECDIEILVKRIPKMSAEAESIWNEKRIRCNVSLFNPKSDLSRKTMQPQNSSGIFLFSPINSF